MSLFAASDEKTSQVLFTLSLARQAGVRRVWAWGRQGGLAAAMELVLVPEQPGQAEPGAEPGPEEPGQEEPGTEPAALDVSGFTTWGAALAAISGHATGAGPVAVRVAALPIPGGAVELPVVPALERLRHQLTPPEP